MIIAGKKITQKYYLFDGCHKFYLIDGKELTEEMKAAGYEPSDIHPIDELPYDFYNSCGLRFIQTWDFKTVVPQCRKTVTFRGYGKYGYVAKLDFHRSKVYTDESDFKGCVWSDIVYKRMV